MFMNPHIIRIVMLLAAILPAHSTVFAQAPESKEVTWDQVKPVFQKRCFACHRGEQSRGGLDLSTVGGIKAGSTSGAAVVAGKPEQSMIYTLPAHLENPQMPPNSAKLPQRELDLIYGWIQGGLSEKVTVASAAGSGASRPSRPVMNRPKTLSMRPAMPKTRTVMEASADSSAGNAADASADKKGDLKKTVKTLSHMVTAVAASPTASLVAVAGHREVTIFQWTDQSRVTSIPFPAGDIFVLRFSRDGSVLLVGGGIGGVSGKTMGFDVATGAVVFETGEESDVVLAADISPNGMLVAVGGPSRLVRIYNTVTGEKVADIRRHTDWILSAAFSNDGLLLATGDRFGSVQIWEAATGSPFHTLRGHSGAIHELQWAADSNTAISASEDGTLRIWDMHEGVQRQVLPGEVGGILATDAEATGRFIAGGRAGKIRVWNSPGNLQREITMADEVTTLAITQDGTHVIAADVTGNVELYNLESGKNVGTFVLP